MTNPENLRGDFIGALAARGLVHQSTSPDLGDRMRAERVTAYIGFDPTAPSLHVGSLLPLLALVRLQRAGHRPIALVGGATGLIGDPSGKEGERGMMTAEQVATNVAALRRQLERFLDLGGPQGALLVDNAEWLSETRLLAFLRDIGKHFSVNQLIQRDSVRPRLEDATRTISFTEFTYSLLQAYDFLVLHDRHECTLQMGGSDQWGNIVAGCDLIRRLRQRVVNGLTMPLLTRADGRKFGKSEQGNVWLDASMTSPYAFYQFWLNTDDKDVVRCLYFFTMLSGEEIAELEQSVRRAPEKREAQRALAAEVTRAVHSAAALASAQRTTEVLFGGGDWGQLTGADLEQALASSPHSRLDIAALGTQQAGLVAVLAASGLAPSRGQARQAIESGAILVNNERVTDVARILDRRDLIAGRFVVLRRGKKAYHVLDVGS